jgi:glycosyltransferase involved in cell wall biosynthesis
MSKLPERISVCMLYRKQVSGFFSIERVFDLVGRELGKRLFLKFFYAPFVSNSVFNIARNIWSVRKLKADIFHVTGDVHYLVLGLPRNKTILTIHDCVFLYQTKGFKRWFFHRLFLTWPVSYCKLITTISDQTKNDIIKYTGCAPEKIIVIPNPVSTHIKFQPRTFSPKPVLLFIGTTPNKNLERVIYALPGICCTLDIVGKISASMRDLLHQQQIEYTNSYSLTDEQLAGKYENADIILFPSLFEGFGLPVVEGQKAGRPVVTSNLQPMKDVAGDGACLIDPFSIESIRQGILKVIDDGQYRVELVNKGFVNVKKYEAECIGNKYLDVYERFQVII